MSTQTTMNCSDTKIAPPEYTDSSQSSQLPDCSSNTQTAPPSTLPQLSISLNYDNYSRFGFGNLYCSYNQITLLPPLPQSLTKLDCEDCKCIYNLKNQEQDNL